MVKITAVVIVTLPFTDDLTQITSVVEIGWALKLKETNQYIKQHSMTGVIARYISITC